MPGIVPPNEGDTGQMVPRNRRRGRRERQERNDLPLPSGRFGCILRAITMIRNRGATRRVRQGAPIGPGKNRRASSVRCGIFIGDRRALRGDSARGLCRRRTGPAAPRHDEPGGVVGFVRHQLPRVRRLLRQFLRRPIAFLLRSVRKPEAFGPHVPDIGRKPGVGLADRRIEADRLAARYRAATSRSAVAFRRGDGWEPTILPFRRLPRGTYRRSLSRRPGTTRDPRIPTRQSLFPCPRSTPPHAGSHRICGGEWKCALDGRRGRGENEA